MTFALPIGSRHRPPIVATLLAALAALAACPAPGGGNTNLVGCLVDTEQQVTDLGSTPPGFSLSPSEAHARALGRATGILERRDGAHIGLTLMVDATGPTTLQRRSWQTPSGGWQAETTFAFDCEDTYALPVVVRIQALPDLDVTESTTLTVAASGRVTFDLRLDAGAHPGSAAPPSRDVDAYVTAVDLLVGGQRDDGPWAGEVGFGIERQHGAADDPDGTVSYTFSPYGDWSATPHDE